MTFSDIHDRNVYSYCKGNYCPTGISRPTDAETILEMQKRIEELTHKLREAKKYSIGDTMEIDVKGTTVEFTLTEMRVEQRSDEICPRLIIKGNVV